MQYKLFTTPMCPKCPAMKEYMASQTKISGEVINCHTPEGLAEARKFVISSVPTVIFIGEDGRESRRCGTKEEVEEILREIGV
jgi:glutaredoxin